MKYSVHIETLTSLHIGSGQELLRDFDYVDDERYTYILDQDAIYAHELEEKGGQARLDLPAGRLIATPSHERLSHFVRYRLRGATPKEVASLHEQIKDVFGRAYLPGSSLKGAIRRALMAWAIATQPNPPDWEKLKWEAKEADDLWESYLFGKDPHHDVFRLLQVTDSDPLPEDSLIFCHAAVFQHEKDPGSPIDLEAIASRVTGETHIQIDELLLQYTHEQQFRDAARELRWSRQAPWFTILPAILRAASQNLLEAERQTALDWGFPLTVQEYDRLLEISAGLADHEALLQIGWGGGWFSKTVGQALDEKAIFALQEKFDLGKPPKAGKDWKPNPKTPFPNSRRLTAPSGSDGKPVPGAPLGWVKLTFEPLGAPRHPDYWITLAQQGHQAIQRPWKKLAGPEMEKLQSQPEARQTPPQPEPRPKPGPPPPPPKLIPKFSTTPKPGDCFEGLVFDASSDVIYLEIPGLDADEQAYAVLLPGNYPGFYRFSESKGEICRVLRLEDEAGVARVVCELL